VLDPDEGGWLPSQSLDGLPFHECGSVVFEYFSMQRTKHSEEKHGHECKRTSREKGNRPISPGTAHHQIAEYTAILQKTVLIRIADSVSDFDSA
jgi:hypothetical protein